MFINEGTCFPEKILTMVDPPFPLLPPALHDVIFPCPPKWWIRIEARRWKDESLWGKYIAPYEEAIVAPTQ